MKHTTPPSTGSNSDASLDQCAALIRDFWSRAKSDSRASLNNMRLIGETLNEAKEALQGTGKGAFGEWCEREGFPFDKSWRARLMKLAAHWEEIIALVERAAPDDKRAWSLDGALALYREANKPQSDGSETAAEGDGTTSQTERKETKAEKLERMLREALERIQALENENAALRGRAKAHQQEPKGRATVDAATVKRASKVWALWKEGGTDGEKAAAKQRLEEMAGKAGLSFDDFVSACGLKSA